MMDLVCPRCHTSYPLVARFCSRCGLMLQGLGGRPLVAGRVHHPQPLARPEGFQPCPDTANLHFRWESAMGGSMLVGTEGVAVILFNGGYPLQNAALNVRGENKLGRELFAVERTVVELPRGREAKLEIPSYELPDRVHTVRVSLISAEFTADS